MQSTANNQLIQHFLEESARVFPNKCAIVHDKVRVSYGALNQSANRLARWLIKQGIEPGDRIVLLLENCPEYIISYYGILKAGGVAVPLNPELRPNSLHSLLTSIAPRIVISSAKYELGLHALDFSALSVHTLLIVKPRLNWTESLLSVIPFDEIVENGDAGNLAIGLDEANLASIIFTSGTTKNPKGVMLSHRNIAVNTLSIIKYLELSDSNIQMVVLPFFYVMGKSLLNTNIAVGGTVIINNKFAYPASVLQQMVDEKVTGFSGVPSTYAYLLHRSPLKTFRDKLTSLRYCTQAGGHMARHIKEELIKMLPEHTKIFIMYGTTEAAARLTYVEPHRLLDKIDSIGIPVPNVTMRVLDENGLALPKGEIGELVASGPNIMLGYWKDPDNTARVLNSNGYLTGDLGYQDEDGYFHIVGRKDNQLKMCGHRLNPQEIEEALVSTGLIIEAAVLSLEDALAGHKLVAIAVPIDSYITEQDILRRCYKLLPRYKLPSEIRLVKMLPKHGSGKIERAACAELYKTLRSS